MHKTLVALTLILSTAFADLASFEIPAIATATSFASAAGYVTYGDVSMNAGTLVAKIGDFNADGVDDYAVAGNTAAVYIVLGKAARATLLDFTVAGKTDFLKINVVEGTTPVVSSISSAGDFNKDGTADIIIGVSNNQKAYVVYGLNAKTWAMTDAEWPVAGFDIAVVGTLPTGKRIARIGSTVTTSKLGEAVAYAGDINGDGVDDVAIGQSGWQTASNKEGSVCVVFGKALQGTLTDDSTPTARGANDISCVDAAGLLNTDKKEGILLTGAVNDQIGSSLAYVGDINGDGKKDIAVGSKAVDKVYIAYGYTTAVTAIDLSDATKATKITGPGAVGSFGTVLAGNGDFNGDGYSDLAIGHPEYDGTSKTDIGRVYVVFGAKVASAAILPNVDFTGTVAADKAVTITGSAAGDNFGWAVALADVNKNDSADLIVGAPLVSSSRAAGKGKVYVVYGRVGFTSTDLSTTTLTSSTGITITGPTGTNFGLAVAAGDVTKDGIADIIIGAPAGIKPSGTANGLVFEIRGIAQTTTPNSPASGFRLHASLLVLASFFVALMF